MLREKLKAESITIGSEITRSHNKRLVVDLRAWTWKRIRRLRPRWTRPHRQDIRDAEREIGEILYLWKGQNDPTTGNEWVLVLWSDGRLQMIAVIVRKYAKHFALYSVFSALSVVSTHNQILFDRSSLYIPIRNEDFFAPVKKTGHGLINSQFSLFYPEKKNKTRFSINIFIFIFMA